MQFQAGENLNVRLVKTLGSLYDSAAFRRLMEFSQGELQTLLYLRRQPETLCFPTELSMQLGVTRQRMTSILSSLRKKSYVTMHPSVSDRRRTVVAITAEGEAFAECRERSVEHHVHGLIEELGETDTELLIELIQRALGIAEVRWRKSKHE